MGDAEELDIDELLLPGERKYTFRDIAELGGLEADELHGLWTSAGFPDVRNDEDKAFTQQDVLIVRNLADLRAAGIIAPEAVVPGAQALGQALSRLAEWQANLVQQAIEETRSTSRQDQERGVALVIDHMDSLQTHIWRRHLAAATRRIMTRDNSEGLTRSMAVGFADMVGYTRLSRGLAIPELNTLITTFETQMQAIIYGGGGWIVKGVGDEVMFAAVDPAAAARIALELQSPREYPQLTEIELELPELRVGVAYGDVLQRYGDLYGTVVNLAARLTSAARPGTVLIDDELARAIADEPDLRTKSLRPYRARGFNAVHPHLLRWAKAGKQSQAPQEDDGAAQD